MNNVNFTTSEFFRLQKQCEHFMKLNRELTEELAQWKPRIDVSVDDVSPAVNYTCRTGTDGFTRRFTTRELASAPAEVLAAMLHEIAEQSALLRTKAIAELVRPYMQRAANYSQVACKGERP